MVQKIIGLGVPDKGNGDPLRTAFSKVNDNFAELYNSVSAVVVVGATAPINPSVGDLWWNSESGRMYVYYGTAWVDASPVDGAGIASTNELVNGNKTVSLASTGLTTFPTFQTSNASLSIQGSTVGSTNAGLSILAKNEVLISTDLLGTAKNWNFGTEGKLTLPAGTTYEYLAAPLTGHGDGLARLDFTLVTDGVDTQWAAASASPAGSGYNIGDTFTFDAEFLGIPGASVTIEVLTVGAGGSVENLAFTQPPLYPADIYRDSPINLQVGAESNRWTFGATGTTTFPVGVSIKSNSLNYRNIVADTDLALTIIASGTSGSAAVNWSQSTQQAGIQFNNFGAGSKARATITASNNVNKTWVFDEDGTLTFPDSTAQTTAWTGSVSSLVNGVNSVSLDNGGLDLTFTGGEKIKTVFGGGIELYRSGDNTIGIYASGAEIKTFATGGAKHIWTFGTDGTTQFPSNRITQTLDTDLTVRLSETLITDVTSIVPGTGYSNGTATTTGGSGTGLIISINTDGAGHVNQAHNFISLGQGYKIGDVITIVGGNNDAQVTLTGSTPNRDWTFSADGTTTFPGSANISTINVSQINGTNPGDELIIQANNYNWTFGTNGALTFPNGTLKITDSVISNLNVVGSLSTGSQIQVGSGVAADTGIIISNGTTNDLGGGGSVLQTGSVVNVHGEGASMALRMFNSLGEGGPALTSEQLVETGGDGVRIGMRVTNDPGEGEGEPLITFQGWTFDNEVLSLPMGAVIWETASSPGLYRTQYSGNFVLDPTWFAANAGNIVNSDQLTDSGLIQSYDVVNDAFSFQYFGYFVPPTSANYTFRAHADETFVFWIGSKALSGYTYANKDMYGNYNGTFPEQQTQSFTIALTAGEFYPIRIQWANSGGIGQLDVFTWANDVGQANTADFTGRVFRENTGTAKIAVNDNRSIILSTDNATDNNWTFAPNGALTFPDGTTTTGKSITVPVDQSLTVNTSYSMGPGGATTFKISPEHIKLPTGNGVIFSGTEIAANSWGLDSANKTLYFPDAGDGVSPQIRYSTAGNDGMQLFTAAKPIKITTASNTHWTFGTTGNLTLPASGDVVDSTSVSQLAKRVEGSWTVTTGTNTYSFTVPADGTYTMWVKGNIPNGIITWNATLSITNSNVPAIGTQYAWNYTDSGSPILLTAIPNQIRGSAGTISTDNTYAGTTSNRFDFGISNSSGSSQTIYYGYTKV